MSNAPMTDASVPALLQTGTPLTKVSSKKRKRCTFRIDPDQGQIVYESSSQKFIPIEVIKELRFGSDARYYREQFQLAHEYEDRWITIIYILDGEYKTLHLIADTLDVFNMWNVTLRKLHAIRQQLMSGLGNLEMRQAMWEKHYWKAADLQEDQRLEFSEVEKLCRRLNISSSSDDLKRIFKQADIQNRNFLEFEDFQRFVRLLKTRPEIHRLYKRLRSETKDVFTFETFEKFMLEEQQSTLTSEELQGVFNKFVTPNGPSREAETTSNPVMEVDGFAAFLLSPDNSPLSDVNGPITHNMTRPLPEYFVFSSHNTYLVGNQLVGVSTVEGYIRALLHGCRSVELDIYDGDTEPMIFHGKTLTSKVSLREVCEAIKKYGFVSSPYPIIISAEIHCGLVQQDMMADIMLSVFGDALVQAPINGRPTLTHLPSPEDLKGRILLKAKNLLLAQQRATNDEVAVVETFPSSSGTDSEFINEVKEEWQQVRQTEAEALKEMKDDWEAVKRKESETVKELRQEFQKARNMLGKVNRRNSGSRNKSDVLPSPPSVPQLSALSSGLPTRPSESGKTKAKMSMALLSFLVYTVGVKCRGINKKEVYAPEHLFSLSENTANKMLKMNMVDLIKHTRTHMVRIYPKGMRLSSTNYEPHRYWSAGCQLVAINCQTFDLGYMINHTMFERNGRAGYVLKPLALRAPDKELLSKLTDHYLEVTIISAQQLPRPKDASGREVVNKSIIDPFVEVSVHVPEWTHSPLQSGVGSPSGVLANTPNSANAMAAKTISYSTSVVKNNGFNPVWEETLRIPFKCVGDMKDLIFVRFAVRQSGGDDGEVLAVFCASLGTLQQGYRHLPLHDAQLSQYLFSTLFVRIHIQDLSS